MDKHKSSLRDNEKLKAAMQQAQEKHNRRIQEMKEVGWKIDFYMIKYVLKIAMINAFQFGARSVEI